MRKKSIIKLACLSIIALACSKNEILNPDSLMNEESVYFKRAEAPEFTTAHDIQLNELAQSLNQAVRANAAMRKFIHTEALLRFDGDYEFLINKAVDKPVEATDEFVATRSSASMPTFGEMIRDYLPKTKSDTDLLAALQEQYPDLQVAVPVHAEDWDPEKYIPAIVFEPEDYEENETLTIPGYDSEGNYIEVDAINEPDVPVIVISHNEGTERMSSVREFIPIEMDLELMAPTNLTGTVSNSCIVLSWQYAGLSDGFEVWRKGPGDATFLMRERLFGRLNRGYQDSQVVVGGTYQYYVTAYNLNGSSAPSNYITVSGVEVVEPLTSFKVIPSGLQLECEWTHGQVPYADVVIEHKGPYASNYTTLRRVTDWSTNYCFTPSNRGKRHDFRIYRENGNSQSDALTDYIYPPYRNTNEASYVYLKKIEYPGGLEGWFRGDAEFDIVITYYNSLTNSIQVDSLFLRTPSGADLSVLLKDWRCHDAEKDWYSLISIHMVEQDPGTQIEVSLNAKKGSKRKSGIISEIVAQIKHVILDEDDNCGSRDLYYYDNPEQVLQFPSEGVSITISENP